MFFKLIPKTISAMIEPVSNYKKGETDRPLGLLYPKCLPHQPQPSSPTFIILLKIVKTETLIIIVKKGAKTITYEVENGGFIAK